MGELILSPFPITWSLRVHPFALLSQGALNYKAVSTLEEWYRLLTSIFLHVNIIHLFFNCVALGYAAAILERFIGPYWFTAIFLLGGIGGGLCSLYLHQNEVVSAGASGGVMALFSSLWVILKILPKDMPFRKAARADALKILIIGLIPLSSDTLGIHIDIFGHLGGAITGFLMGFGLYITWNTQRNRPRFQFLAQIIIAMAVIWFLASLPKLYETYTALKSFAQTKHRSSQTHDDHPQKAS